jgi:endogenous inhibitor of DNA gyrase (YacG/DUF329 family)
MTAIVKCPHCGRSLEWSVANTWRPFCSERCKLIDLGAWFKEGHAIPGEPALDIADDGESGDSRH